MGMESLRELYKIGRGPSSSHTMGPEKACLLFAAKYSEADTFSVTLYGSLAKTGKGHCTDKAIVSSFAPRPCEVHFDTEKKAKEFYESYQTVEVTDLAIEGKIVTYNTTDSKWIGYKKRDIIDNCEKNWEQFGYEVVSK